MQSGNAPWPTPGVSPTTNNNSAPESILCSPRIDVTKCKTASEILAAFSPRPQPPKKVQNLGTPPKFEITMSRDRRDLRQKPRISYNVADDSDDSDPLSAPSSSFTTPQKKTRTRTVIDLDDDDEDDEIVEIEPLRTPPPRVSSAGHSLRQHKELYLSLKAQENGDKQPSVKKEESKRKKSIPKLLSDAPPQAHTRTVRNGIRDTIATETTAKRARYFVSKKDYFLPLLPENNHIKKLVDQSLGGSMEAEAVVPYELLETQPAGVKASMKPYQLGGLSFLVYLQRNGLSGILGDEMGLGKTLQTLSLIQYLKENGKASEPDLPPRPSLVVCPLSVLSSWMAESRKWTPGLKVLRFHGPVHERARLKRIASGEEDMFGNDTRLAIKKKNKRMEKAGKDIIDLDPEHPASDETAGIDLVVTTYETFSAEQGWFKRAFVWKYAILDEGHKIKNDLSQVSTALQGLGAEYRLILTGTPLQNNLVELWALLHWLYPEVFTDKTSELFKTSFDLGRGRVSTTVMDDARRLLELIMIRRMKNSPGVDLNLPPKTDLLLFVPLTPLQRFWYTRLLTRADKSLLDELFSGARAKEATALEDETKIKHCWEDKAIDELEELDKDKGSTATDWKESKEIMRQAIEQEELDESKKTAWKKLMNLLMQLRKCCNHPYLLPHAAPDPYYLGDHVIHGSGKFIVLDKLVEELVVKQKKKILIFSGFTRMLDCCEDFLNLRGGDGGKFRYLRLDGGTGRARRNLGIRMFNDTNSDYRVMLISTRAGGLGINLATASDVVMLDQDWNPQIMLQAEARAHRIGQTKPVTIYKLCTQGTVEEQMMGRIQKKLYLSAKVTESMRDIHSSPKSSSKKKGRISAAADEDMPQLNTSQLMSLVRRGAQALSHPEINVNEMLGWDWETTLEKCKDKPADIHVAEQTQSDVVVKEDDEKKWLSQMEHVEARVFQGKKFSKTLDSFDDIRQDWTREHRRIGKNTTVMVDGYAVNKESMNCGEWEAVPTMAGKDPRLAEPKREKKPAVVNQEHCQVCWDGGHLTLCSGCPRSYHYLCLDKDFKAQVRAKAQFHCPQHQCADCLQKTGDAGGLLYRCRWCERGYCEDCLDWDKTTLLGDVLKEYELLGFPAVNQAFYIQCPGCTEHHLGDSDAKAFCSNMATQIDAQYSEYMEQKALDTAAEDEARKATLTPSRAGSLTDATTLDDSGLSTPQVECTDGALTLNKRKRKAAPTSSLTSESKRSLRMTM